MKQIKEQDYKKIQEELINYIKKVAVDKKVIIGLSGGIDSSLTCLLAKKALGKEKVKALIMTNTRFSRLNLENAKKFALSLGIEYEEVNSTSVKKELIKLLKINEENDIESASADARICDVILKTIAMKENRIYLGTINGTERLTGWYPKGTLFGDFCPIGGLLKEQIKNLALFMGLSYLVETVSNEGKKICSGCGELPEFEGIPYISMDNALYLYQNLEEKEIEKNLDSFKVNKEVYNIIISRVRKVKHKMDIFPDYCKIK